MMAVARVSGGHKYFGRSVALAFARTRFYSHDVRVVASSIKSYTRKHGDGSKSHGSPVRNDVIKSTTVRPTSTGYRSQLFISARENVSSEFAGDTEKIIEEKTTDQEEDNLPFEETFASMLRKSKLIQAGPMSNRIVLGTVIETIFDDLYIDFGGKFHSVCQNPKFNTQNYQHGGIRMKMNLGDFEMTTSFLGSKKHLTLQEADGVVIGLHRSSKKAF